MKNKIGVSIIIPIYNTVEYLDRCLRSCSGQTYTNIEIVAINDGSIDSSGVFLDEYAIHEPRLKVIHKVNEGVVSARNTGIAISQGEYILFVDSDDYMFPEAIELMISKALENDADIVISNIVHNKNEVLTPFFNTTPYGINKVDIQCALLMSKILPSLYAKLYKRELLYNVTSPQEIKICEDFIISLQLFEKSNKIIFLDIITYGYVFRDNSVINTLSPTAINSLSIFINWLIDYQQQSKFTNNKQFQTCCQYRIYIQFINYLIFGGDINKLSHTTISNLKKINNKEIKFKFKIIANLFLCNHLLGNIYLWIYNILKKYYWNKIKHVINKIFYIIY